MMLKRILPFVLTLMCGVALASLASFVNSSTKNAGSVSDAQSSTHDKTWLVIQDLPTLNYMEDEAREKGAARAQRLLVLLDADGTVSQVVYLPQVSHGYKREITDDAIEAARRIRFIPATEDGQPISLWVTIDYSCTNEHFAHKLILRCSANIVEVERDWRTIYE